MTTSSNTAVKIEILDIDRRCGGCEGRGRVPSSHGWGLGTCAACRGSGRVSESTAAKKAARRIARAAAYAARAAEARDALRAAYPEAVSILDNYAGNNGFIKNVAAKFNRYGTLSENQANAIVKAFAKDIANAVTGTPVVEGRIEITGKIVSAKEKYDRWGDYVAITVEDDRGFKVFGRIPRAIDSAEVGDRVAFTATVTKSDRDATFGFFNRAAKAKVLS